MTSITHPWSAVEAAAPDLASTVQKVFDAHKHKIMATLRADGSPRVSGTELQFGEGHVVFGSMGGSRKAHDLLRDGRCAIHAAPIDLDLVDGDAKIAGVARALDDVDLLRKLWPELTDGFLGDSHAFVLDVTEVVLTRVQGDELVIDSWDPDEGVRHRRRT